MNGDGVRVPLFAKVILALIVVALTLVVVLAFRWSDKNQARRDANCAAWEWVIQRVDDPTDPKVAEFVKFMRDDLGCHIDSTPVEVP